MESLLSLRHPRHEVIVVDDGSTDDTFAALVRRFELVGVDREIAPDVPVQADILGVYVPDDGRTRLTVVRKANSGKTDAVNTGINASTQQLVAIVDADSVLDPDALIAVTEPFVVDPVRTVATGGVIRAANGCTILDGRVVGVSAPRQWLARIQVVEYPVSYTHLDVYKRQPLRRCWASVPGLRTRSPRRSVRRMRTCAPWRRRWPGSGPTLSRSPRRGSAYCSSPRSAPRLSLIHI